MAQAKGKIQQVLGAVVDVEFADGNVPAILDALETTNNGQKLVLEVAQHLVQGLHRLVGGDVEPGLGHVAVEDHVQVLVGRHPL